MAKLLYGLKKPHHDGVMTDTLRPLPGKSHKDLSIFVMSKS
jgi:hypothetical protein